MKDAVDNKRAAKKRISGWVSVGVGTIVLAVLGAWGIHYLGPRIEAPEYPAAQIRIEFHRYYGDYPTGRSSFAPGQTILTTLWELIVTNTGSATDTILNYSIFLPGTGGPVFYTGLDQGLVDTDLNSFDLPLVIESGHAIRLFVKVGVLVVPKSETLLVERFPLGPSDSIERMLAFLHEQGIDLFGYSVEQVAEDSFTFPQAAKAPGVMISVMTTRGNEVEAYGTWYPSVADVM